MLVIKKELFKTDNTEPSIPCGGNLEIAGQSGIYEITAQIGPQLGITGFIVDSQSLPDRFQIEFNGNIVADTKYIGDSLEIVGSSVTFPYPGLIGTYNFPVYKYDGIAFSPTGEIREITNTQSSIPNNFTEATNGNVFIYFNKTTPSPTEMKLIVTSSDDKTYWEVKELVCPVPSSLLINGIEQIFYGPLPFEFKDRKYKEGALMNKYPNSTKLFLYQSENRICFDRRGYIYDFSNYGWNSTDKYVNDGTNWHEIDQNGYIITSGSIY